jgi:hypothetical protein
MAGSYGNDKARSGREKKEKEILHRLSHLTIYRTVLYYLQKTCFFVLQGYSTEIKLRFDNFTV